MEIRKMNGKNLFMTYFSLKVELFGQDKADLD